MGKKENMMRNFRKILFILFLNLFLLFPLLKDLSKVDGGLNFFSTKSEVALGERYNAELQRKLPIIHDREISEYINMLGYKLVEHCKRKDITYHFYVVNTSDVNAFAVPGGFIYVYRGLIDLCSNEGELAGVVGHEIGHIVARHSMKQLSKKLLIAGILSGATFAISRKSRKWAQIISLAGGVGFFLTELKYSRDDERQADYLGIQEMYEAGYDPYCMVSFFKKMEKLSKKSKTGSYPAFLRTHPLTKERIRNAINEIEKLDYSGGGVKNSISFNYFKDEFRYLPPPQKNVLSRNSSRGLSGGESSNYPESYGRRSFSKQFIVPGNTVWKNSGIYLKKGDIVEIYARGRIYWKKKSYESCTPDGAPGTKGGFFKPISSELTGTLIGKIGNSKYFRIGSYRKFRVKVNGYLYLGINDDNPFDNRGKYFVKIRVNER